MTSQPVTVYYTISGNAVYGTDYTLGGSVGQIVIPAGNSAVQHPVARHGWVCHVGKPLKVKLKLSNGVGYKPPKKAGKSAIIKIK